MVTQQLSPHHYPSHVLFQFILVAFLKTQHAIERLKVIRTQLAQITTREKAERSSWHSLIKEMLLAAEELVGATSPFHGDFCWNPSYGILSTLKNDSILFEKSFIQEIPEAAVIKKQAGRSWTICTEMRDLTVHLTNSFSRSLETLARLQKLERQFSQAIKILSDAISQAILRFKTNENVLLCLIQRQKELDAVYGLAFTHNILKKMHLNLEEAHCFLVEAYCQRKFNELIPEITSSINSLHNSP